jgi:LPXTG-motif cell wall-anchored protein
MALYEQDEVSGLRRGLGITALFVVTVVVLWTLVWLVFYRNSSPKVATKHSSGTTQSQKSSDAQSASGTPGTSNTSGGTTPTQLANTGAGNIMVPFAVASMVGSALYYVRLRRKLLS